MYVTEWESGNETVCECVWVSVSVCECMWQREWEWDSVWECLSVCECIWVYVTETERVGMRQSVSVFECVSVLEWVCGRWMCVCDQTLYGQLPVWCCTLTLVCFWDVSSRCMTACTAAPRLGGECDVGGLLPVLTNVLPVWPHTSLWLCFYIPWLATYLWKSQSDSL